MRPPPPLLRVLLLLTLLLFASPTRAKRKKAPKGKLGNAEAAEAHARLLSERDRLLAALAKAEQRCDAPAEAAPLQPKTRPALQPAQLAEFTQKGYTIVRALVPGDVAIGPCQSLAPFRLSRLQAIHATHTPLQFWWFNRVAQGCDRIYKGCAGLPPSRSWKISVGHQCCVRRLWDP
jgi:hypothetical protein